MRPFIIAIIALPLTTVAGLSADWVGYGGPNGSRVYPQAKPPTTFGKNDIAWTVKLPDWGHGSPIVIGEKVFLLCEFTEGVEHYPSLVCLSAKDGKLLWKALLDHTPVLPNGAAIKKAWETVMTDWGKRRVLIQAYEASGKSADKLPAIEAAGYEYDPRWNRLLPKDKNHLKSELALMRQGGFALETWRQSLGSGNTISCVGQAHATPMSDGERVYVQTAFGGFFCFDLAGKLLWCAAVPGQAGEYCRNGRSPILYKNLLLSDITNKVRAFDKLTGTLLWSDDGPAKIGGEGASTIVSPAILTVAGKDILYAAGNCAYLLPDGKRLTVEGWKDYGMQTLVKHDERDVVFFCGSGEHCGWTDKGGDNATYRPPAAVRFRLEGDSLNATVLWNGKDLGGKETAGGNSPWMLYHAGKFYHVNGAILNALTGKVIAGAFSKSGSAAVPGTRHLLCAAGNHVFGLTHHRGRSGKDDAAPGSALMSVFTLDGQKVADNVIPGIEGKNFSYGWTFTFDHNSIYVRGLNHLIKIGK
jgi:outer membrane protein assembly factor BamB